MSVPYDSSPGVTVHYLNFEENWREFLSSLVSWRPCLCIDSQISSVISTRGMRREEERKIALSNASRRW